MQEKRIVVGLMSGTSVDAVDAALIETDGIEYVRPLGFHARPYSDTERRLIRAAAARALTMDAPGHDPLIVQAEEVLTIAHAEAVAALPGSEAAVLIGFHGQTVAHRPPGTGMTPPFTWQIGDAALLARRTRLAVVHDFRSADVAAGGQGAPLAPGFHRALASRLEQPLGVLNLGGVANLTWFAGSAWGAFDTGPANGLIDDWVTQRGGGSFDEDGRMAAGGHVREAIVMGMASSPWFDQPPPKSLDRGDFSLEPVRGLAAGDGAATLTAFTAETVRRALGHVPVALRRLLVTGGGRHNPVLMQMLTERTGIAVDPVETVGWQGDALEAQAFGWLAVRHIRGLPLSWPETTGVPHPQTGGRLVQPD